VLLHDHRTLRLAVLNSCEGARATTGDPFASLAASLVRQGIPAVTAMQFEISDRAACTFAEEFYAALAQGYPVDAALAEARKAIYCLPEDVEWGTPVLYMRSPDGVLFDVVEQPSAISDQPAAGSGQGDGVERPVGQPGEPAVVKVAPEKLLTAAEKAAVQARPDPASPVVVQPKAPHPLAELSTFIHIPERNFW